MLLAVKIYIVSVLYAFGIFSERRANAVVVARVGVREIGLRSFSDCTGRVFGIGDINDCLHDSGNKPASKPISGWTTQQKGYASSSENSFNTRLRIPSGPAALETLIFANLDLTSLTEKSRKLFWCRKESRKCTVVKRSKVIRDRSKKNGLKIPVDVYLRERSIVSDSEISIRWRLAMQLLDMLPPAAGVRRFETRDCLLLAMALATLFLRSLHRLWLSSWLRGTRYAERIKFIIAKYLK